MSKRGLYQKYRVERTDGRDKPGEKHHGCKYFVIDLTHDPLAVQVMLEYARLSEEHGNDALASDIRRRIFDGENR